MCACMQTHTNTGMYAPHTYIHWYTSTHTDTHTHTIHMWNILYTNMHKTYIQYSTYVPNTELAYTVTHKYRTMHWVHTMPKPLTNSSTYKGTLSTMHRYTCRLEKSLLLSQLPQRTAKWRHWVTSLHSTWQITPCWSGGLECTHGEPASESSHPNSVSETCRKQRHSPAGRLWWKPAGYSQICHNYSSMGYSKSHVDFIMWLDTPDHAKEVHTLKETTVTWLPWQQALNNMTVSMYYYFLKL